MAADDQRDTMARGDAAAADEERAHLRRKVSHFRLLLQLGAVLHDARAVEPAIQACLDAVCAHTGWCLGHAFLRGAEPDAAFVSTGLCHTDPPDDRYDAFRRATKDMRVSRGEGLVGHVLASARPVHVTELGAVAEPQRAAPLAGAALRSAFAMPVLIGSDVVAVLEFFSQRPIEPDRLLQRVLAQVARQLSHVIEHKRSDQQLEARVRERTAELQRVNEALRLEVEERHRVEQQLRHERREQRIIFDSVPALIWYKDAHNRILRVNAHAATYMHRSVEELEGHQTEEYFPEHAAQYLRDDLEVVHSGQPKLGIVECVPSGSGEQRWVRTDKVPYRDDDGNVIGVIALCKDITEQRRAEAELRALNETLERRVAERTAELHRSNEALERRSAALRTTAEAERAAHVALKQAHARMLEQQKLAALGQLVAGVAHEINNPLAFVINNAVILQRDVRMLTDLLRLYQAAEAALAEREPALMAKVGDLAERIDVPVTLAELEDVMARSREGLARVRQIVNDLRDFARQDTIGELQHGADLNSGIESTINMGRGRARKQTVTLETDLRPLPPVTCMPAKVNQVILNLVVNAIDACGDGGTVTVRSRPADGGVEVQVSDTGSGIPPEIRERIFDPFFTTKPQGQGTGLGLSISHGIVTDHGGRIDVDSRPGHGTTFTVYLPLMPPKMGSDRGR